MLLYPTLEEVFMSTFTGVLAAALLAVLTIAAVSAVDSIGSRPKIAVVEVLSRDHQEPYYTYMFNGSTMIPVFHPEVFKLMTPTPCEVNKDIYKTTAVGDKIVVTMEVGLLFKRNKYCTFLRKHHE